MRDEVSGEGDGTIASPIQCRDVPDNAAHHTINSPREVSRFLDVAFAHQRGIGGRITRLRPRICPFEEILARIPPQSTVLDVGCGVGTMSALAAGPGNAREVVGFDISSASIGVAKRITIADACPLRFHQLPAGEFPSGTFDVVLCIDVMHHVPPDKQWEFLQSVCDRVANGGLLVFKDISPQPWWKALANRMHDLIMARQWVNYRHEREVAEKLRSIGGEVVEQSRLDRLWYSHYLVGWRKHPEA